MFTITYDQEILHDAYFQEIKKRVDCLSTSEVKNASFLTKLIRDLVTTYDDSEGCSGGLIEKIKAYEVFCVLNKISPTGKWGILFGTLKSLRPNMREACHFSSFFKTLCCLGLIEDSECEGLYIKYEKEVLKPLSLASAHHKSGTHGRLN